MATVKNSYRASSAFTVTNLHSLASSSTWVTGWKSAPYDNTTNLDTDARISGLIALNTGSNPTANTQVIVWVMAEVTDGTWPDSGGLAPGSEGTGTWDNVEMRDASCRVAAVINLVEAETSNVMPFECGSVAALFGGILPRKFIVFIAHNAGNAFAASGSAVYVQGIQKTIA